jgi:hypothetical protein
MRGSLAIIIQTDLADCDYFIAFCEFSQLIHGVRTPGQRLVRVDAYRCIYYRIAPCQIDCPATGLQVDSWVKYPVYACLQRPIQDRTAVILEGLEIQVAVSVRQREHLT